MHSECFSKPDHRNLIIRRGCSRRTAKHALPDPFFALVLNIFYFLGNLSKNFPISPLERKTITSRWGYSN